MSFLISVLGLAKGTVVSSMGGVSVGLCWVSSAWAMANEVVESAGGVPPSPRSWLWIGAWVMEGWCHLPSEFPWDCAAQLLTSVHSR